ncbi:hypothetical protein ADIAL_0230 [Alkalibacterium sp. AK22]|uniref:S4 domain-containing protein YaaA n=1 Tax=Alkalibacterium sp. AK22 TaxID=1229520 RepID=UPI000450FACB|nr:hypothetical protein ADIAL_0230 [Alkalibacterium sp. AK22]
MQNVDDFVHVFHFLKEPIRVSEIIEIDKSVITLGQFLKHSTIISSGGMAKPFLMDYTVWVNDEADNRRGRKLYPGDVVKVEGFGTYVIKQTEAGDE